MRFNCYPETDSLYIDLSEKASSNSTEVAPGVVLDFDIVNLTRLEADSLPVTNISISGPSDEAKAS